MFTNACEPHWLVLYTRNKFEKKVARDLACQSIQTYLPLRIVQRKWSDRIKNLEIPLFQNYLFVKSTLAEAPAVLQVPGSLKFIGLYGKPYTVREEEIQKIRLLEKSGPSLEDAPYFTKGDRVKVVKGVFCGVEGTLLRRAAGLRLVVSIPLLKQAISVEVDADDIVKII
jgi:transcription antitermination factor NusG